MNHSTPASTPTLCAVAATTSCVGAACFLVLLATLHLLKPEMTPSWHMISEYAIGDYGWVMQAAFIAIALGCIAMATAIRSHAHNKGGTIGWLLLLCASLGMTIAGFNATDPIGTPASDMSSHGKLHGVGFLVGVPSLTLGITLLTINLRSNSLWASRRIAMTCTAATAWLSLVALGFAFGVLLPRNNGVFGPEVMIGWPNRIFMVSCSAWMIVVARHVLRLRNHRR